MIADFYVCPNCLHVEFGEIVEEDLKSCPKCGSEVLRVYTSGEAQHLIIDIWNDHGEKIASLAIIVLAMSEFPTLSVEVRDEKGRLLKIDELAEILKSEKDLAKEAVNVLRDNVTHSEPISELLKVLQTS